MKTERMLPSFFSHPPSAYSTVFITELSQRPDPVYEPIQACHDVVSDGGEGDNCNYYHKKQASFLVCIFAEAALAFVGWQ